MAENASLEKWYSRVAPATANVNKSIFNSFMGFLRENGGMFSAYTPDELVEYQRQTDNGNRYEIIDIVQRWILSLNDHRVSYKRRSYAAVKSFFLHNRAPLPKDPSFRISGDKPKVKGQLTVDIVKNVILASNATYRAIFLSMFQGGMGLSEFVEWNNNGIDVLRSQLKDNPDIIKIELSGRKHERFQRNFYTYIGFDAIEAIRHIVEQTTNRQTTRKETTKQDDVIFLNQLGDPISKHAITEYWKDKLYSLGHASRGKGPGHRTGMNIHELRDLFRSQWELSSAKSVAAEYFMGHKIDDLEYNKIFDYNEQFARTEYRKAVPFLNIMSSSRPFGQVDEEEVVLLRKQVEELQRQMQELRSLGPENIVDAYRDAHVPLGDDKPHRVPTVPYQVRASIPPTEEEQKQIVRRELDKIIPQEFITVDSDDETQLLQLLNEGWDVYREINGKLILRK